MLTWGMCVREFLLRVDWYMKQAGVELRRGTVAALLAVLVAGLGLAQPGSGSGGAGQEMGRIVGRVMDATGGEALGKADVRLSGGRPGGAQPGAPSASAMAARTGADGAFALEGIGAGEYVLTVSRRGYAACGVEVKGLPGRQQGCATRFTLREGQKLEDVRIRLLRAAVITGEVRDEDGEPMAGVVVEAEQYRYLRGSKLLTATSRATTDDRGYYRIFNLSPGRYFVKAQGRGLVARMAAAMMAGGGRGGPDGMAGFGRAGMLASVEEAMTYPARYYPSAEFAEEAIPLQLASGAEMGGIDFRLVPSATYSIRGAVMGVSGGQMAGIAVTARRAGNPLRLGGATAFATADGRTGAFTLRGLTPGRYEVVARSAGTRRGAQSAGVSGMTIAELGTTHLEGVTISLRPDAQIEGRVVLAGEKQEGQLERMRVVAEGAVPGPRRIARVDAEGRFQVAVGAADRMSFAVEGVPDGFYVKAMKLGGVDMLATGAEAPAEALGEFVVELGADGGSVEGVTRDGEATAAAGARVVLMPERSGLARSVWAKTAVSGDDGSYRFSGVAPGRYRLYVFEELANGPALDPDFLTNFGQRWKSVEVKPGAVLTPESPLWVPVTESAMHLGDMAPQ